MSCELYNVLTDNSILSGTGPCCRYEGGCPQTAEECKWGPMLRQIARNMALEDTDEDLEQDKILADLKAKDEFNTAVKQLHEESAINSLISISRVN